MFKKITNNLIPSIVVALIVIGFIIGVGVAVTGGGGSVTVGDLNKGLVFHAPLREQDEKVGSELHTDNNAASDSSSNETNATTGWASRFLTGTGANVFESQNTTVHTGTYALHANSNDTPTSIAGFYKDIGTDMSLATGKTYRMSFWVRHVGTGGTWVIGFSDQANLLGTTTMESILVGDTTWTKHEVDFTYESKYQYFGARESSVTNNGGVYVDDVSVKEIQTADTTPNANHGTVYGATQNTDSMSFDGTDDYVDLGTTNLPTSILSVSLWINPTSVSGGVWQTPLYLGTSTVDQALLIAFDGTNNDGSLSIGRWSNNFLDSIGTLSTNTWAHVVLTSDSTTVRLYIDGAFDNSNTETLAIVYGNAYLGAIPALTQDFNGSIDDVRIYNRVLSQKEVTSLYNLGGRQQVVTAGSLYKGLVLDMPLNSESEKVGSDNPRTFTITQGTPVINGDTISFLNETSYVSNAGFWTLGKTYRVNCTVANYSGTGDLVLPYANTLASATKVSANGTYEYDYTPANNTTMLVYSYSGHTADVTVNSVKPIQTADTTPNGNHGTVYGATVGTASTSFDGVDDYVNINDEDIYTFSGPRTITLKAYFNDVTAVKSIIAKDDFPTSVLNREWSLGIYVNSTFRFYLKGILDGSIQIGRNTDAILSTGTWYNMAITYDGGITNSSIKLYLDGVQVDTTDSEAGVFVNVVNGSADVTVGSRGGGNFFDGSIDDVRIYNRALTSDEIEQLYNLGGRQQVVTAGSLYKGLILDMPLNSESEKVGSDMVVNGGFSNGFTNWSTGGGWLHSSNSALYQDTGTSYLEQTISLISGKTYRLTFNISNSTTNADMTFTDQIGTTLIGGTKSLTDGTYNYDFIAISGVTAVRFYGYTSSGGSFNLDDITIKELQTSDTTPNGNHGTVYGATQNSDDMSFDGTDDYVSMSNINVNGTISLWFNATNWANSQMLIGSKDGVTWEGYIQYSGGTLNFYAPGNILTTNWGSPSIGNIHHIVITSDGVNHKAFLNGVLINTTASALSLISGVGNIVIGSNQGVSAFHVGSIKNVKFYNRALSASEIQMLYNQGR